MATARSHRGALLLTLLFLNSCSSPEPEIGPESPKHVVLIVVDTLRADHLSTYGYGLPTSPHLDQLTDGGVRFERAFAQSSWTAPSMVSLMTGCYLGEERLSLPKSLPVIAELFHDAGYATGAFIHNPIINSDNGFERGFDTFNCPKASDHNNPIKGYPVVEPAAEWINVHAKEDTFTYVHYSDPHSPYGPQSEERQNWMKNPPALSTEIEHHLRTYTAQPGERLAQIEPSIEQIRVSIAGYNDDVVQSDLRIGQIIDKLKEHGLYEDAVIIVTSDHGEGLWTREDSWNGSLRRQKRAKGRPISLYNLMKKGHGIHLHKELIHIPLILKAPEVQRGTVNSAVEGVDLFPTLLELCGLPLPTSLQGHSLLEAIRDDAAWEESRPFAFSITRFASTVVTQDGWHLLLPNQLGECQESMIPELYHLPSDPFERENVASQHPALVSELTDYISDRIEMGITRNEGLGMSFTPTNQDALIALGYIDNGIIEAAISALSERTVESMLEYYVGSSCVLRLELARELVKRELNEEQLERVRGFLQEEDSQVIYEVLRSFL
jgi:arylsulfatase A-like enzyme